MKYLGFKHYGHWKCVITKMPATAIKAALALTSLGDEALLGFEFLVFDFFFFLKMKSNQLTKVLIFWVLIIVHIGKVLLLKCPQQQQQLHLPRLPWVMRHK